VQRKKAERMARRVAARPVVSSQAQEQAARPDVRAGLHRERLKVRARPSAVAARKVRARQAAVEVEATAAQRSAQAGRPVLRAVRALAVREAQQAWRVSVAQPQGAPDG
jgi:hypothetical protein